MHVRGNSLFGFFDDAVCTLGTCYLGSEYVYVIWHVAFLILVYLLVCVSLYVKT